jgi:predicted nucleic acid-binding protein
LPDALIDNDVVLKFCRIGHLADLAGCLGRTEASLAVLGSLRFVLGSLVGPQDPDRPALDSFLMSVEEAEPSEHEIRLAAQIEEAAQRAGHAVDAGESLLFAMGASQSIRVATGDKRAILGLAALVADLPDCRFLLGSVVTLEWLASALLVSRGLEVVRASICSQPSVDRTLCACFQCKQVSCTAADVRAALLSYQSDLAGRTNGLVTADLAPAS